MSFAHRFRAAAGLLIVLGVGSACAGASGLRVTPNEIPDLEAGLARSPDDVDLRVRYASALFAAGRCDDARTQAEKYQVEVRNAVGLGAV